MNFLQNHLTELLRKISADLAVPLTFIKLSVVKYEFNDINFEWLVVSCLFFANWGKSSENDSFWLNLRISNSCLVRLVIFWGKAL